MKHKKYYEGGSAFPYSDTPNEDGTIDVYTGMSLRDYFAAQAMTAINPDNSCEDIARWSYDVADAMLAQKKGKKFMRLFSNKED